MSLSSKGLGLASTPNKPYKAMLIGGLGYNPRMSGPMFGLLSNSKTHALAGRNYQEFIRMHTGLGSDEYLTGGTYEY